MDDLYIAGQKAIKTSNFKYKSQRYEANLLGETRHLQKSLKDGTYKPSKGQPLVINERGKVRHIVSNTLRDKAVNHYLTDEFIRPAIEPYLIYDNGASRVGKGVAFARERLVNHLRKYYAKHGNKGYILLMDFHNFYGSIDHERAKAALRHFVKEEAICKVLDAVIDSFNGDVGIDMGNQISQEIGVLFPYYIDNYVKIVRGQKYYARYSDDSYIISDDLELLKQLQKEVTELAARFGLEIHPAKTHIARIDKGFRYLQRQYTLTETGKVIEKISPKSVTRERRKLKAYKRKVDDGTIPLEDVETAFKSWMCANYKVMSNRQILNLIDLYGQLFGTTPEWPDPHRRLQRLTGQKHGRKIVQ